MLQAEGQALVEKFKKDQEILSDEEKLDLQQQLQDKQTDIQFLSNKLQTKAQEVPLGLLFEVYWIRTEYLFVYLVIVVVNLIFLHQIKFLDLF